MQNFDKLYNSLLVEFNVQDRNDPTFYDYVVIFLQQLLKQNLIDPKDLTDLRKTATEVVKNGFYLYKNTDPKHNISLKINFDFSAGEQNVNNLIVKIQDLLAPNEPVKTIENTFDEESINDITDYIETKKTQALEQDQAGEVVPAAVGETPSQMPQAEKPADTSKYLKGL